MRQLRTDQTGRGHADRETSDRNTGDHRRSVIGGVMLGIGLMAAVDEIVFHQLLAWHHFFDLSTPTIGLISDGLLHAAELILLVLGFFVLGDLLARDALVRRAAWAGCLAGMGGFQLFDGLINHKVLGLHQVRYVDHVWVYDLAWNGIGLCLLVMGVVLGMRARQANGPSGQSLTRPR